LPGAFLEPDLYVVARGAVLVLEQVEECAGGEADGRVGSQEALSGLGLPVELYFGRKSLSRW